MVRFNDIADTVLENNPDSDLSLLQRAYVFSAKVHDGQERLSGEPYLIHPLAVASILAEMRLDEVCVVTGLLHDTVEDTLTTLEAIERMFGDEVAFLVEGLTKLAKVEFTTRTEKQAENFRKMLLAMSKDIRILLIKLADRLHNMRTLKHMDEEPARRVAQETLDIYVPLAHRLGIHWMKEELEGLSFQTLKPNVVKELNRKLKTNRRARSKYVHEVIETLENKLAEVNLKGEVTGRLKSLPSIHNKMESQGLQFDEVHDVIAFRIIIDAPMEIVYTVLGVIHSVWPPVAGRFKDYVALPKPNGYQSLHTTVIGRYGERMEIQTRTSEMHRRAENGIAAHWRYKHGDQASVEDDKQFAWLRQLLEWQRELDDPHEFLDAVKVDLFPDEVYVFTPKGRVLNLPKGATPIDFAYAIHTEVGDACSGARVNAKMVALRTPLHDGDTVEILTDPHHSPRKDWLEIVVTGKARNRIRQLMRLEGNKRSLELGRGIVERALRKRGLTLSRVMGSGQLDEYAKAHGNGSAEGVLVQVGYGRLDVKELVSKLLPDSESP
ncbi:MAG: bifunctional (p)ppGpp synthetase/guanosine-3',5'-bis(diphosphate) 3'-pyrophosphohydrolase, partial [Deltaproteobacteria bacterium]|nr:bifunctional (p)ppGpp synthetase/guanosine-3',5'-bis(diphosphate) 3'-pyrophosphohydrolase [Deltaproteobacteria bacterium]